MAAPFGLILPRGDGVCTGVRGFSTRSYGIEYVVVCERGYGPDAEFGVEP